MRLDPEYMNRRNGYLNHAAGLLEFRSDGTTEERLDRLERICDDLLRCLVDEAWMDLDEQSDA